MIMIFVLISLINILTMNQSQTRLLELYINMQNSNTTKNIKIKTLTNQVYNLTVDTSIKVSELKIKIAEVANVPVDRQRLVYMGKLLLDDQSVGFYVKEDEQTIHLMAKTESTQPNTNQPQQEPSQQQSQSQPQQQHINPNINPFNLLSGLGGINQANVIIRAVGPTQNNANMNFNMGSILDSLLGRPPQQNPPTQGTQSQQNNQSDTRYHQVPPNTQPNTQPTQARQQGQNTTSHHNHNHTHTHTHTRHAHNHADTNRQNPQQATTNPVPLTLPFNLLYQLGTHTSQLMGNSAIFPGPPLPQVSNRNSVQVLGAYLSNWQFQISRTLPFVGRLGELLQRQNILNDRVHRQEAQAFTHSIAGILNQIVAVTQSVIPYYQNLRLGSQVGQFTLNSNQPTQQQQQSPVHEQITEITIQTVVDDSNNNNINQMLNQLSNSLFGNQPLNNLQQQPTNLQQPQQQPTNLQQPQQQPQSTQPINLQQQHTLINQPPQIATQPVQSPIVQVEQVNVNGRQQANDRMVEQQVQQMDLPFQVPIVIPQNIFQMIQQSNPNRMVEQVNQQSQQQQQQQQQQPQQPQQQQPSFDMGSMMSMLGGGGFAQLTNSTLRDILKMDNGQNAQESLLSVVLGDVITADLIQLIIHNNVDFLDQKHHLIQQGLKKAISRQGSLENLIDNLSGYFSSMLVRQEFRGCFVQGFDPQLVASEIFRNRLTALAETTLGPNKDYAYNCSKQVKLMIGQLVNELAEAHENGVQGVIALFRQVFIRQIDKYAMGMAGLAWTFFEKKIYYIHDQYVDDLKRQAEKSKAEQISEEKLLQDIESISKRDEEQLKQLFTQPHGKYFK